MNRLLVAAILLAMLGPTSLYADDVPAVTARFATEKPWVGQRIAYYVEVRAPGSFSGATSFSLPQVPQTVIVKMGSPTVSSEQQGDETWFVQIHEFAIFTQAAGELTIPSYAVRYAHKEGFTGPVFDKSGEVPATSVTVEAPPGRQESQFVITTDQLKVTQTWQPEPGLIKQGDIAVRTITQSANEMTGMALAPPSLMAPDGVDVYSSQPKVNDKTDRGELSGERIDVIRYQFVEPGPVTIPGASYTWWDPRKEQFGKQELPAVTFNVQAAPQLATQDTSRKGSRAWVFLMGVVAIVVAVAIWNRRNLSLWCKRLWKRWHRPDRVAARRLIAACRRNDPVEAERAWSAWLGTQAADYRSGGELPTAVAQLHQTRYRDPPCLDWEGTHLLRAFQAERRRRKNRNTPSRKTLPALNPGR